MAKLEIEMIPVHCHYSNVRSALPKKEWDRIRKLSYKNAKYKCEICGDTGKNQGKYHAVECHEIWNYDYEKKIQKLDGLISLCPNCHLVKHFGRANALNLEDKAFEHLKKVNEWTDEEVIEHLAESYKILKKRNKHIWKLNLKVLIEDYGVKRKLVTEGENKSRDVEPPWKKKWLKKKKNARGKTKMKVRPKKKK